MWSQGAAFANIQSTEARKRVRDAQDKAQEEHAQREKGNVEVMATFLVSWARLAGVEAWETERVAQVVAEAARRRDEHRGSGAAALARIRQLGETIGDRSEAETTESLRDWSAPGLMRALGTNSAESAQALARKYGLELSVGSSRAVHNYCLADGARSVRTRRHAGVPLVPLVYRCSNHNLPISRCCLPLGVWDVYR
jgi:hypothetical protein